MTTEHHPVPWEVKYHKRADNPRFNWHPCCSPYIVDANGCTVVEIPQTVNHPGDYDATADETANAIVKAINAKWEQWNEFYAYCDAKKARDR